jgi:hypothetical protein
LAVNTDRYEFKERLDGFSTETKPTNIVTGAIFYEIDSATEYKFDGTNWLPYTKKVSVVGNLTGLQSAGIDIGSTPVELTAGMTDRKQLIIYPPSAGFIYWGATNVNLATNGAILNAGSSPVTFDFALPGGIKIYALNDGTVRNIRVVESK